MDPASGSCPCVGSHPENQPGVEGLSAWGPSTDSGCSAAVKPDGLQPMAQRAPPARACQPPPLLMVSATCSADTRCSALAGLVPGCRPSTRQSARPAAGQGRLSEVHSPESQARFPDTDSEEWLPSCKVSGFNRFHHFPHSGPIPWPDCPFPTVPQPDTPQLPSFTAAP
jgi:hypothetical protein